MNINILEKMNKVPGGLIIIPLLVAILINTFAPQVLSIGGPTTALFKVGSSAMMGIFLLICGTSINIRHGQTFEKQQHGAFIERQPGLTDIDRGSANEQKYAHHGAGTDFK